MEYPSLSTPPSGSIRFNTDSSKMEIYNGEKWWEIDATSPEAQIGGTRGVFGGGIDYPATLKDTIEYVNVSSTGNSTDFGNLLGSYAWFGGPVGSRTRGVWIGHQNPSSPSGALNVIEYVEIASTGNSTDFGDQHTGQLGGCTSGAGDRTRGLYAGGYAAPYSITNAIGYITIAQTGNSVDFGDLTRTRYATSCMASPTRGVFGGTAPAYVNTISYVNIQTQGNAAYFGDLNLGSGNGAAASNAVRGIFFHGLIPGAYTNSIDYVTMASQGNAVDFGDKTNDAYYGSGCASPTRAIYAGGATPVPSPSTDINTIMYVEIMTTGNATDFGDLTETVRGKGGLSNGHGGLG